MNRTLKPLFRPEVIRSGLRATPTHLDLGEAKRSLAVFSRLLASRDSRRLTEENLKPGFLTDVLGGILGYRTPNQSPDSYSLVPEFPVPGGRGTADAAIGRTPRDGRNVVVAVEVKGPLDPLDIPHGGRRLSAVEQGFDYAINLGCDWILVTSMAETRLYYKGADRFTCERFLTLQLAQDEDALRRFIYLLGADRVVPEHGRAHFYELLDESETVGKNITTRFYTEYSEIRTHVFSRLRCENPGVEPTRVLSATQKLLDRILFCAFAEDRTLLPTDTLKTAFEHSDPYNPRPKWDNFLGLFRAINDGNPVLRIPKYNGGLFAADPFLENLRIPDEVCAAFKKFGEYNYHPLDEDTAANDSAETIVDVEILGHIFEQSITDLERKRLELEGRAEEPDPKQAKARRKKEGAFYTPKYITRHIVENTLGPVLEERFANLRSRQSENAHEYILKKKNKKPTAKELQAVGEVLRNPRIYDVGALTDVQREALVGFWLDWQVELGRVRILDPACGSGAFLIEAFDQLLAAYQDANARLEQLRGVPEIFDLNRQILQKNLYGVDLNDEAVEICRLSLWIKTAEHGKILTDLDHTIRVGNSIIDDPAVHERAFDWRAAFPEVFADGGFDAVIGNPPYIRQEWLAPYKDHLKARYIAFSGGADLYLYFFEKGLQVLRPGGRLGFITSGTFARGNFAVPFRSWLPTVARFASLVNFGENQPFEDAEMVFPTISILEKRTAPAPFPTLFIHEQIPNSLDEAMQQEGLTCDESVFEESEWKFQPKDVTNLAKRIETSGTTLDHACEGRFFRGLISGLNEAFVIDATRAEMIIREDEGSAPIIRPLFKGEDLRPWYQDSENRWLIAIPSGYTRSALQYKCDEEAGWAWFASHFPRLAEHLLNFEKPARDRLDQGDFWWELRACSYYDAFEHPKIIWPDIQKLPRFSSDESGRYLSNTCYFLNPPGDWLLPILNSRVFWFQISQRAQSLRLRGGLWQYRSFDVFLRPLSIPGVSISDREEYTRLSTTATSVARERHALHGKTRRRIATDLAPADGKLNNALTTWWTLDFRTFHSEVKKAFKKDIPVRQRDEWESALKGWRGEHERLTASLIAVEEEINDRVYRLYGLSKSDITLLEDFQKRTKTFYPLGEV